MFLLIVRRCWGLFWVCAFLSACAAQSLSSGRSTPLPAPVRGRQLHGQLVELRTQRVLSLDAFITANTAVRLIAVGEEHDHPDIQAFELQLLQALSQQHPQHLALAMEFLERDMQPWVDAFLAGRSDAATLQQQMKASPTFIQYYFPLLDYARQAGIPVLAMNLPRRLARQVAQQGLQPVLSAVTTPERQYVPMALTPLTPQYRTYFQQAVARAHPLSAEQTERFLEASHLKDETMAETLSTYMTGRPHHTVLAIAGRFHIDYGLAIPARLQQRAPALSLRRLTTMSVEADEMVDVLQLEQQDLADYVWFAPPHPAAKTGT
ncbi:MAG: ChaN family lipoprotein [Candidatus Tectimicrobiota bacterium]